MDSSGGRPPGLRRRAREAALALLYQKDLGVPDFAAHRRHYFAERKLLQRAQDFAVALIDGVLEHADTIDSELARVSTHWRIDRMNVIDRNVLRLAIYEILFLPDVPRKVSINEAIDLGKAFGTEESGAFINGILDRFKKPARPEESPAKTSGDGPEP